MALPEKRCNVCGRVMAWRKAWAKTWDTVKYCSNSCRKRGVRPEDPALETAILSLLDSRSATASICPSEAARAVRPPTAPGDDAWLELMEPARMAARRLEGRGEVAILQRGQVVEGSTAKGPIRIRRIRSTF